MDPHLQCFPDLDHLFQLGIQKNLIDFMQNCLSTEQKTVAQQRLRDFPPVRSWANISLNFFKAPKKFQPMAIVRKESLLWVYLLEGLCEAEAMNLLLDSITLRTLLFANSHTDASVKKVKICF